MAIDIMGDIAQVLRRHFAYRYLAVGDTQLFHQVQRILVGAVGGSETGHGDTYYPFAVIAQEVGCLYADKQGERAVETAGDSQNQCVGVRMFPTACEGACLDREDIQTVLVLFAFLG